MFEYGSRGIDLKPRSWRASMSFPFCQENYGTIHKAGQAADFDKKRTFQAWAFVSHFSLYQGWASLLIGMLHVYLSNIEIAKKGSEVCFSGRVMFTGKLKQTCYPIFKTNRIQFSLPTVILKLQSVIQFVMLFNWMPFNFDRRLRVYLNNRLWERGSSSCPFQTLELQLETHMYCRPVD